MDYRNSPRFRLRTEGYVHLKAASFASFWAILLRPLEVVGSSGRSIAYINFNVVGAAALVGLGVSILGRAVQGHFNYLRTGSYGPELHIGHEDHDISVAEMERGIDTKAWSAAALGLVATHLGQSLTLRSRSPRLLGSGLLGCIGFSTICAFSVLQGHGVIMMPLKRVAGLGSKRLGTDTVKIGGEPDELADANCGIWDIDAEVEREGLSDNERR